MSHTLTHPQVHTLTTHPPTHPIQYTHACELANAPRRPTDVSQPPLFYIITTVQLSTKVTDGCIREHVSDAAKGHGQL